VRARRRAQCWFVDDCGGADFASMQAAVDAASDGDATFMRSGMNA